MMNIIDAMAYSCINNDGLIIETIHSRYCKKIYTYHNKKLVSIEVYDGTLVTYKDGKCHSYNDNPSHVDYCLDGWYKNGLPHRDNDLPAIIIYDRSHGQKRWYNNGKHYRENGLPCIEYANGRKIWYKNNKMTYDYILNECVYGIFISKWIKRYIL
jgi:hypothetical protein